MKWERPDFVEIAMNAEIGAYQSDFPDENPVRRDGPVIDAMPSGDQTGAANVS
jgi:hypothetical protein